ncbi:hypothetical protein MG293_017151 [Ovis ammon polii]|uniref:Uncharacterized protein n=1 Tax=Ovis ammon polii TaxID=230172 RepID=A0AAD4TQV8_OVIAM|nr:hypothetical protein MG293_017151 [Ovis ammon polii]
MEFNTVLTTIIHFCTLQSKLEKHMGSSNDTSVEALVRYQGISEEYSALQDTFGNFWMKLWGSPALLHVLLSSSHSQAVPPTSFSPACHESHKMQLSPKQTHLIHLTHCVAPGCETLGKTQESKKHRNLREFHSMMRDCFLYSQLYCLKDNGSEPSEDDRNSDTGRTDAEEKGASPTEDSAFPFPDYCYSAHRES